MVQQHFLQEDNQAFATYLMLEEYPELKEIAKYRNPSCNGNDAIKQEYEKIKEYANENNIDITEYTDIVDKGYSYVSDNFSWESTGYYWKVSGLNEIVDNCTSVNEITEIVNKYDYASYDAREEIYNKICICIDIN